MHSSLSSSLHYSVPAFTDDQDKPKELVSKLVISCLSVEEDAHLAALLSAQVSTCSRKAVPFILLSTS
jgi:hypothetical protein